MAINFRFSGGVISYSRKIPVSRTASILAHFLSGIYFDRLDNVIATKKEELSKKVKNDIVLLCFVFLVAVIIALLVAYKFSKELQNIFDTYKQTQLESFKELEILNGTLEKQSQTDALTQIYNRGFFNQQLISETLRANRYKEPLSLVLFDVDHFKMINDTHGHLAGNMVLKELASLIQENVRQCDFHARWGRRIRGTGPGRRSEKGPAVC